MKDPQERAACLLAVRVLDAAEAEAWDVDGRQGRLEIIDWTNQHIKLDLPLNKSDVRPDNSRLGVIPMSSNHHTT